MKRFLFLALIYSLNILMFLFAKSAGAAVVYDKITDVRGGRFTLVGHQETVHLNNKSSLPCLKEASRGNLTAAIELDDVSGRFLNCRLAVSRLSGIVKR